jgi:hypothetical protein
MLIFKLPKISHQLSAVSFQFLNVCRDWVSCAKGRLEMPISHSLSAHS